MKKFLALGLALLSCVWSYAADGRSQTIRVADQAQFDQLNHDVRQALSRGVTQLTVALQPGTYYYSDQHLDLSSMQYPKAKVEIVGESAILVGRDGEGQPDWQQGCFDPASGGDVDLWSPLMQSPDEVDVVDPQRKLCRIRTARSQRSQRADQCRGQYVQITEWYKSMVYPVVRRDSRHIYFTATDLEYSQSFGQWNVNYDYAYGKVKPRYRTIDTQAEAGGKVRCLASTFVRLHHASLASVRLQGITFGPNHGAAPLIDTDMLRTGQLLIYGCTFGGVRGLVVKVWYTDNVLISNNRFVGCWANGVESYNGSARTQIIGNTFENHGRGLAQNFGIICRGEDFEVRGNRFRNFCYAAIGVGLYHAHKAVGPVRGVVADNDIAFDATYYRDYAQHTLMDGGAIYAWTQCDDVRITGNRIDHYRGVKDYRGIFCDDGTKNVTVQHNTVTNIGDGGWCIDLRWVDHVRGNVPDHNTGNRVSDNTVDGKVRFETRRP